MRTKRIDLISQYVNEHNKVTLDKLCEVFDVSKNTIRRDIGLLSNQGKLKKVYGGVVSVEDSAGFKVLTPFSERSHHYSDEKLAISKYAASLINNGDIVYIDTGTTSLHILDYIGDTQCTVITNSLQQSLSAVAHPNITVFNLPGKLRRETLSFVGDEAEKYLKKYNISKAFMCCTGISIDNGLTNATTGEYIVKKAVIENSKTNYILADHSKFGKFTLLTFCPLDKVDNIITDTMPDDEFMGFCNANGVNVYITP